ncbi:MAG: DUF1667 domain-containing protein [Thermoguttaceae bacterium]|nr:DUF1667 domain-containing protein [Thermoguttaceae bacterium]
MSVKNFICIVCPKGCALEVDAEAGTVVGNSCKRGEIYGLAEATNPTRTLTTTARVEDEAGNFVDMAPARTSAPIPKGLMFDAMREIAALRVRLPIRRGDVFIANILGTGADVVATRDLG